METGVPPTNRNPTRWKLGRHNSHSSVSQESRVDDMVKDKVFEQNRNEKETRRSISYYLPREVIYGILLFLPAKLLHEVVRYVCKQWYDIVSDPFFVRAHCQMTTTTTTTTTSASYLIQYDLSQDNAYCADQDGAKSVKVTKINLPLKAKIQGSCNGLILLSDYRDERIVHVMNPVTKLIYSLPPVYPMVVPELGISYVFAVNSFGQYKVGRFSFLDFVRGYKMSMFTIGVDKAWRRIDVQDHQGIPLTFRNTFHTMDRRGCRILIAGFMYWCSREAVSIAMDVDTETLYQISWPTDSNTKFNRGHFISMGTALGLLAEVDKRGICKILRLTDVKSSEWTAEIDIIDIGAIISKVSNGNWTYGYNSIDPVSLIHGELCFHYCGVDSRSCWIIRYNLANESFASFEVDMPWHATSGFHHVPTLVSPKNYC